MSYFINYTRLPIRTAFKSIFNDFWR